MFQLNRYFANPDGTSLQGYFTASYKQLEAVFGLPTNRERGDTKVSTEWIFEDSETKEVFKIYDYKEVKADDTKAVEEFRNRNSYEWHIGGIKKASIKKFGKWLETKVSGKFQLDN